MTVVNAPAVQQYLWWTVRPVVAVFVCDERQMRWRANEDSSKPNSQAGSECQFVGE